VRWDALFADLEAQAALMAQAERAAEVEERARGEIGALTLADRARAAVGAEVRVRLAGAGLIAGRLRRAGPDWWLIEEPGSREAVVPTAALLGVRGLGRYSAVPGSDGVVAARLGLRQALRGVARDRSPVRVQLIDGSALDGTLDRVGADFVDVAAHPAGELRRHRAVRDVEAVPLAALAAVRRSV
jgi:hypothetical protein